MSWITLETDETYGKNTRHSCIINLPYYGCGAAINRCIEDFEGRLAVDNDEYASYVNYCPFCGYEAKTKVEPI